MVTGLKGENLQLLTFEDKLVIYGLSKDTFYLFSSPFLKRFNIENVKQALFGINAFGNLQKQNVNENNLINLDISMQCQKVDQVSGSVSDLFSEWSAGGAKVMEKIRHLPQGLKRSFQF